MYPSLSTALFREVRPEFFRVLAGAKTINLWDSDELKRFFC
jgi:hypothetical protein